MWGATRSMARGAMSSPLLACAMALSVLLGACATAPGEAATPPVPSCNTATTTGEDVDAVRRLEERGARTNVEGWGIEEARQFFAPTWVSVGPDGTVKGVDTVYGAFVDGRSRPWATRFDLIELDIRVYCGTAIVIGLAEARGSTPEQIARFRYLNVWRKVDGRWLYSEQQFTRLAGAP